MPEASKKAFSFRKASCLPVNIIHASLKSDGAPACRFTANVQFLA
jgi:hypothetical protein